MELTMRDVALLPARLSVGATMLKHGVAKVQAEGNAQAAGFFEQLGFRPGARWAWLAGAAEVAAGVSLILGLGTRLGAAAVLGTQAVAVSKVHWPKGFDNMAGGWEFNALIMATALGVLLGGPGALSVHELIEDRVRGGARWLLQPRRRTGLAVTKLLK
jgi:putative oxidoreductase